MIIRTVEEARKAVAEGQIKLGVSVIVDPFPAADQEDQFVTEEMLAVDREILQILNESVAADSPAADPLDPIRGMSADEIGDRMDKAAMLDLIERVTGERPPQNAKPADLAAILETLGKGI